MGLKFFTLFILFFIGASLFLFYQKSQTLNVTVDLVNTPMMEIKDSKIYNITYEGISAYLQAKIVKRYENRYELYKIFSNKKDNNKREKLWAEEGVLKNDILTLWGNVLYKQGNDKVLSSQKIVYNLKKDILSSDTFFSATYEKSKIQGSSFVYYKKDKRLSADNIKADIK